MVLLLLLLVLLLPEGVCIVTLLPTNRAKIGRAKNNESKWGSDVSWRGLKKIKFSHVKASTSKTLEAGCNVK